MHTTRPKYPQLIVLPFSARVVCRRVFRISPRDTQLQAETLLIPTPEVTTMAEPPLTPMPRRDCCRSCGGPPSPFGFDIHTSCSRCRLCSSDEPCGVCSRWSPAEWKPFPVAGWRPFGLYTAAGNHSYYHSPGLPSGASDAVSFLREVRRVVRQSPCRAGRQSRGNPRQF